MTSVYSERAARPVATRSQDNKRCSLHSCRRTLTNFQHGDTQIAIPNNKKLKSIAWSKEHGYISCGGEEGLLKILKLEVQEDCKSKGLAAQTNLVMNQTLEGHTGSIRVITWNEKFKKITTSDEHGLIIVWMLYKGSWFEEMVNNRNKSVVSCMKWDSEGHRIGIVYEDGAAIVGSVDGNRIWGKELNCGHLLAIEWSPDGNIILFGLVNGKVLVYDYGGNFLTSVDIYCLNNIHGAVKLIGLHWYNGEKGFVEPNCPSLAICYDIGRCQLMRNQADTDPILLDTGIEITCAAWNENGSLLAIAGLQKGVTLAATGTTKGSEKDINVVQFYSAFGEHLRSLCLPGKSLTACAWEGSGSLRLALAVDSFIYFANLRPDHKWAYCNKADTIVYTFTRPESQETSVVFWNTKYNQCTLHLCNALGVAMDSKQIRMEPVFVWMTGKQVIAVTRSVIYTWQFSNPKQISGMRSTLPTIARRYRDGTERIRHIDAREAARDGQTTGEAASGETEPSYSTTTATADWTVLMRPISDDPIGAIAISGQRHLFVARHSGTVLHYRLPDLWLEGSIRTTEARPYKMQANCDATILAVIDEAGILTMHSLTDDAEDNNEAQEEKQQISEFVRKDVWDIKFAEDSPRMFAIMEKTRLFIFDGFQSEPAIQTSTFICHFSDLEVVGVLLDELIASGDMPSKDCLLRVTVKAYRDCQAVLEKNRTDAMKLIEANPHPRLRRLFAETYLAKQDLDMAEFGFVLCQNYAGIQFVKRLRNIQSKSIRKAETDPFFGRIDEAEQSLLASDRPDLAVELRRRMGDWFRVAQLAKDSGALVKDADLADIWNSIGDHFADQMLWDKAAGYYRQGGNLTQYAECLYQREDYSGLERLVEELPDGHILLPELAMRFASIGLAQQSVYALVKCNRITEAIHVCLELNQWQMAIELVAQQSSGPIGGASNSQKQQYHQQKQEIDRLLNQSVTRLLEQGRRVQAVELYKRAGKLLMAAKLMYQEAQEASKKPGISLLQLKKMHVIIGLLMEQYSEQNKIQASLKVKAINCAEGVQQASSALAGLLLEEQERTNTNETSTLPKHRVRGAIKANGHSASDHLQDASSDVFEKEINRNRRLTTNEMIDGDTPDKWTPGSVTKDSTSTLQANRDIGRLMDQPWRGAEAYHFLMLAQRQMHAGAIDQSLRTAQLLRDYEDILQPRVIYSLIALCAIATRAFATCSKAFIKLESLPDLTLDERAAYEQLTLEIFTKHQPVNGPRPTESAEMDSMLESESKIPICVVTGQPVTDYQFWMCPTCKHSAYEQEITQIQSCPLCHFPVQ